MANGAAPAKLTMNLLKRMAIAALLLQLAAAIQPRIRKALRFNCAERVALAQLGLTIDQVAQVERMIVESKTDLITGEVENVIAKLKL